MKKTWKKPYLEILDVSQTMKWPKDKNPKDPEDPEDLFDS